MPNQYTKGTNGPKVLDKWLLGEDCGYKCGFRLKTSVREYVLEKAGFKCSVCGWDEKNPVTGRSPLEVNHIDGDCTNCRPENLEVLCPNHHALTPTWKALNKGNGNKERHRYSGLIGRIQTDP